MMNEAARRPFYTEYAWAFDLLIDRPVRKESAVIAHWLVERGILPGAGILDAGCGTGRYSIELARRGYSVHGVDLSPELVEVARQSVREPAGSVVFRVGDIFELPSHCYSGILCRGVLNDVIDDDRRNAAFAAFARALMPNGVLILDVREWHASADRKIREPVFRRRVSTERGELTFTSVTALDRDDRRLLISERHGLVENGIEQVSDYQFVMKCWERPELDAALARHDFGEVRYFGAYDAGIEVGATDRLVAVAQRSARAASADRRILPMRPGQVTPNEFELAILERLAGKAPSILRSVEHLRVLSREFTGVGSFTTFACEESAADAPDHQVGLDDLIKMPGVPNGMGAVLFCKGGRPQCLEVFTYGDDHWEGVYDGFAIGKAD